MDRTKVSFAQAEGKSEYPDFLKWGEVDRRIRSLLTHVLSDNLRSDGIFRQMVGHNTVIRVIIESYQKNIKFFMQSEIDNFFENVSMFNYIENVIEIGDYIEIFDILQFIVRHELCGESFASAVCSALHYPFSPYRLDLNTKTIIPALDATQAKILQSDLDTVFQSPFLSARDHMSKALDGMNKGDHSGTIREAIHAVESAAKEFAGQNNSDLSGALKKLRSEPSTHSGLLKAFEILYGYTSDEKGIRHSMLFGKNPNVDFEEAIFFVSAGAAFIGYLSRKKEKLIVS